MTQALIQVMEYFSSSKPRLLLCLLLLSVTGPLPAREGGEVKDLYYGNVLYEFYQQNFYSAAVDLLTAREQGRLQHHDLDSQLLLGGLYLSYGLHDEAEKIFQAVLDSEAEPAVRDRAWFYLAKIRYHKGLYPEAEEALSHVGNGKQTNSLEPALQEEFLTLRANLLMVQEKYDQAVASLQQPAGEKDGASAYYARYNLGIALIQAGREREGTELLRALGKLQTEEDDLKALRDRANLTLGYLVLKAAPHIAQDFFRRIRLQGPFSNRALLGLGWVEVELGDIEAALLPWTELSERDPFEIAVFESLLLIGNGLERRHDYPQAMQAYQHAIDVYDKTLISLDQTRTAVSAGRLWDDLLAQVDQQGAQNEMGWFWEAELLPDTPEARYLADLMAGNRFHEAIKNLRDLKFLNNKLSVWQREMPAYADMIALRRSTYEQQLDKLQPEDTLNRIVDVRTSRDIFADELARIRQNNDALALASDDEKKLMARLARVEERLWRISNTSTVLSAADVAEYRDRYRLYKGLLSYDIETSFAIRHWNLKKQLNSLDRDLEKTRALQDSLQQARVQAPRSFDGFQTRVDDTQARIDTLRDRVQAAFADQQQVLQAMVDTELSTLRADLRDYLDRARYSLVHLQEQALQESEAQGHGQ